MACTNPDGSLTASARAMLDALKVKSTPEKVAERTGLPLFRVRSGLREMVASHLVAERDGYYEALRAGS
jgi:hypothetical protein